MCSCVSVCEKEESEDGVHHVMRGRILVHSVPVMNGAISFLNVLRDCILCLRLINDVVV